MTKFNPNNETSLTIGECLDPAMEITDQKDADQYFQDYVNYLNISIKNYDEATRIAKSNLGYYAGYYSNDVRKRVEKLFKCSHPIFGSIADNGIPTGKEAFECGRQGKTLKEIRSK